MVRDELPLFDVDALDAGVAHYRGEKIRASQFIAHAEALSRALPARSHAINLAENRYHFLIGWAAACLRGQLTLLPSSQAVSAVEDLARTYTDHHVIDDERMETFLRQSICAPATELPAWRIPADTIVAIAFTSGTTGAPQPHPKTWRSLVRNAQLAAQEVLGGAGSNIVATVPPQHMYGLEASLIPALSARCCVYDEKPFFPADILTALERIESPRTLVTTPAHLKVLIESSTDLPPLQRIVSATAPLATDLAARIETRWGVPVLEIYGCTEAGVMANRRTAQVECWRTFGEASVRVSADGAATYNAPQLPEPVPLQDIIEQRSESEFFLRGRGADMIKVAGKRASLQDLTRQVLAIPGVIDAVVFAPEPDARPAAFVVAPGLDAAHVLTHLRARMESVFVPRPLFVIEQLPRNAVGKLPLDMLLALLEQHRSA